MVSQPKIDVFIINRDLFTAPKNMLDRLVSLDGIGKIIIVDNDSSNTNVREWYKQERRAEVVFIENLGHKCVWQKQLPKYYNCNEYVVTDSDLDISTIPNNTLTHLSAMLKKYKLNKAGLSIDISDIPKESIYNTMQMPKCGLETERAFLNYPSNEDVTFAPIDTTFALYAKENTKYSVSGARTKAPYSCRHLPFYYTLDSIKNDAEYLYYLKNANDSSSLKYFMKKYNSI